MLADAHGNVVHLGERDCTIQRRHQKLVEETPSPAVDAELRERIGRIAVDAARAAGYRSAGTIEGLLAPDGAYYFMEMNTRVQVEHTITELVSGVDIVRAQIQIARGEPCSSRRTRSGSRGTRSSAGSTPRIRRAASCRRRGRSPRYREPSGPGVRVDSGVAAGSVVSPLYDPMVAKLIVRGVDREDAIGRMLRALGEFEIGGVKTLIGFHKALLEHPCFRAGETCHGIVESPELAARAEELGAEPVRGAGAARGRGRPAAPRSARPSSEVDGRRVTVRVACPRRRSASWPDGGVSAAAARRAALRGRRSPMQGTVSPCRSPTATSSRPARCSASSRR